MSCAYKTITINGFTINYSNIPQPKIWVYYKDRPLQDMVRQPIFEVNFWEPLKTRFWFDESLMQLSDTIFITIQMLCNKGENCVAAMFASHFYESFTRLDNEFKATGRHILNVPLWIKILELVQDWVDKHRGVKIHVGTPLYFLSEAYFLTSNNDPACIYLIKSIVDDIELSTHCPEIRYPETEPAYRTVCLIDHPGNHMHSFIVLPVRGQLQDAIKKYKDLFGSECRLTEISELDSKFLQKRDTADLKLELIKQLFVLELIKLLQLRNITSGSLKIVSPFFKMLLLNRLFSLTLVVDKLLHANYPPEKGDQMYGCVVGYASKHGIDEEHIRALNLNKLAPEVAMALLLEKRSQEEAGTIPREMFPILIAFKIRNTSAHNIHALDVLYDKYEMILQSILEAVFIIVGQIPD